MAKQSVLSAEKVLAEIKAIDERAKEQKSRHVDDLREAINGKRGEMREIEREIDRLEDIMSEITGKVKAASGGGGGRMKRAERDEKVAKLKDLSGETLPASEIADRIGIDPKQWGVIRKAGEAAGVKFKKIGPNRNAKWEIKA